MKTIPLSPYPGVVYFTEDAAEYRRKFKKLTSRPADLRHNALGQTAQLHARGYPNSYIVLAREDETGATLAHEMAHVCLDLFKDLGMDPAQNNGEPFCYLLDHLISEAKQ